MSRRGTRSHTGTGSHAGAGSYPGAGKRRAEREPSWPRRHRILSVVLACTVVLLMGCGGYLVMLNSQFGNIDRFGLTLSDEDRPDPAPGKALNILLLGSDAESSGNANSSSIRADLAKSEWPSGSHRSDTVIVMHISADREDVQLISLPRDLYVDIYDDQGDRKGKDKLNAAFSYYGPSGALATVEHLTGLRMDQLAIVDWNGFKDLTSALGGVRVYIPETVRDGSQNITWEQGWHNLEGTRALAYVRTRHGLENGDFSRIQRQQNFIRTMMKKLLDSDTMSNPVRLNSALDALTSNLIVDEGFTNSEIRGLALSLRDVRAGDVQFITAPTDGFTTAANGSSAVTYDQRAGAKLFGALADGEGLAKYLKRHPDTQLADSDQVG